MSARYPAPVFHEGDVIRKWREELGLKGYELADKADINKNTMSSIEAGELGHTDTIRKVVTALGRTLEELHKAVNPSGALQPGEPEHLRLWRRISDNGKERVSGVLRLVDDLEQRIRDAAARETIPTRPLHDATPSARKRTREKRGGGKKRQ